MGKVDGLLARARETATSADLEERDEEMPALDEVLRMATEAEGPAAWTAGPAPVVEAVPLVRAMERLHQGVRTDLRGVLAAAREQESYLREWKRAYNAMTTDWYKIADELPQARAALDDLKAQIAQRRTELAELRIRAAEETGALIVEQQQAMAETIWQVRRAALAAVGLIALAVLVVLLILTAVALHRPF